MADVEFSGVDKVYAGVQYAIRDIDLRVEDGELMVLVGPSGCGKSTLLRLLAGLDEVTRGTLRIGGRTVNPLSPQERNIAMVFQDYALYPHLTVRGNLEFPLRMRRTVAAERRRRVQQVVDMLNLGDVLERLPRQLSGGQRQRVAMGRALVREPAVLLLDEPLSNLDAKLRTQVRTEIGALQRRTGMTLLYVTHDQVEAMTLGHRVAVLQQGRLQQVAPPRELYLQPANVFVAGFIGNPPMNLFPARPIVTGLDEVRLSIAGVEVPVALPGARLRELIAQGRHPVTAGIRPEAVGPAAGGQGDESVPATVEDCELLGHETLAKVQIGLPDPITLLVRLPGMQELRRGDGIRLQLDRSGFHLFDAGGCRLETVTL